MQFFHEQLDFNVSWTFRGPSLKTKYNERTERTKELNPVFKKTDSNRSKLYAGFAGVAALALFTACGGDEPAPEEEPADPGVEQEDPAQEDPMGEDPAEGDSPAEGEAPAEGDDPAEDPAQEDPMGESPAEGEAPAEGDDPAEDPMGGETEEGAEIEGAGEANATSLVGLAGNAVSWAL